MESLFNTESQQNISNRFNLLSETHTAKWGKMTVSQMLHHCQAPLNVMLQKKDYGLKPFWLVTLFFKKSLYNDKPWRKNLPTAKQLKAADDKDFNAEKKQLLDLINAAYLEKDKTNWQPHPSFGKFTPQQW